VWKTYVAPSTTASKDPSCSIQTSQHGDKPGSARSVEQESDLQEVSLMQLQSPCATLRHSQ